jgi:hypothetical protein
MISGKRCRHLNKEAVGIVEESGVSELTYLTIDWFLRHNPVADLGSVNDIRTAFIGFQEYLYSQEGAA